MNAIRLYGILLIILGLALSFMFNHVIVYFFTGALVGCGTLWVITGKKGIRKT